MNYATERLLKAATESLAAWEGEEDSVREEHAEMIEELESALHYFDAHGEACPLLEDIIAASDANDGDSLANAILAAKEAKGGRAKDCATVDGFGCNCTDEA